jgi:hypothetical protein
VRRDALFATSGSPSNGGKRVVPCHQLLFLAGASPRHTRLSRAQWRRVESFVRAVAAGLACTALGTYVAHLLGEDMNARRWSAGAVLGMGLVVLAPAAAHAAGPPATTPGQSGVHGCSDNGQIIADVANDPGAFGAVVRQGAPIADENAAFFALFCSGS